MTVSAIKHINAAEVLEVQILSVPDKVRRRLQGRDIASRLEHMTEIPDAQLGSGGLKNNVGGSNAAAPPSAFETALETPHADHEVVDLHVTALVQVSQNLGDF